MKHLIIILCDSAPSFCHYSNNVNLKPHLMPLETLRKAVILAMKENTPIQFVYPKYKLPQEYYKIIKTTNHVNITSFTCDDNDYIQNIDIHCLPAVEALTKANIIIRLEMDDMVEHFAYINSILSVADRVNIALVTPDKIDTDFTIRYHSVLKKFAQTLVSEYKKSHFVQMNLITDRAFLSSMNNCNAGIDSLTISPDGYIYICPGFFYDKMGAIGSLTDGWSIPNMHLYEISSAPICRICDAFHCKRCVWKNKKTTHEINTPGHEQCVIAHIERNITAEFVKLLKEQGFKSLPLADIAVSDVLDPFYKLPRIYLK